MKQHSMNYYVIRWTVPELISKPASDKSSVTINKHSAIIRADDMADATRQADIYMKTQPRSSKLQAVEEHDAG